MSLVDEDDLFKDSTMSFGDHLEELRVCLFRAIMGLFIGFIIGLFLGGRVVDIIQTPLRGALTKYYETRSNEEILTRMEDFRSKGYGEDVKSLPKDRALVLDTYLVNPRELAGILGIDPETLPKVPPPKVKPKRGAETSSGEAWEFADYFSYEKWRQWWGGDSTPWKQLEGVVDENVAETLLEKDKKPQPSAAPTLPHTDLVSIYLWRPVAEDPRVQTKGFAAQESFMIYIKASLLVGVLIASPWIFWQIWSFVAAGLYPHEKKYVHIFLPVSLGLFLGGALLAFFFAFQPVLTFLFRFNAWMHIEPDPRISEWLNFFLVLPLGFGISFQLPLVMLFLERIGVMTIKTYVDHWRGAILILLVVTMFLTPPDPMSLILMGTPLCFLYLGGIQLCKMMPKIKNPYVESYED